MLDPTLKSKINQLWDKFWSGGISNPLQAIEQMSYLLFMKRLEDEDIAREQDAQLSGKPYQSIFTDNEECKWSKWSNYPAETILYHVRDKVFPFLRNLGGEESLYEISSSRIFCLITSGFSYWISSYSISLYLEILRS